MDKHNIVIAGAGFGGIRAALQLATSKDCSVTVIADRDTFRYYPALYATATGHAHEESVIPLSEMFKGRENITFSQDTLEQIDVQGKRIQGSSGTWYAFDSLIVALGMVTNYFGIEGLEEFSFGIKSIEEVDRLKDHLHTALTNEKHMDPNYVVVGGGPTGVELAASLRSYIERIARCHNIQEHEAKVDLIEAMNRVLPRMSPKASAMAEKRLQDLGISVMTSAKVEGETSENLTVNGELIPTHTVVWTSGVANNPFFKKNAKQFSIASNSKVNVDKFLQGARSVYIIGDNAATQYSGLAQTALYDAGFVAKNIKRQLRHQRPKTYEPRKPPVVVPVGNQWAIFEWEPFTFGGRLGAVLRRAADFTGYSDLLPLGRAIELWRSGSRLEEACPVCRKHVPGFSETSPPEKPREQETTEKS